MNIFNEAEWTIKLTQFSEEAFRRCGLSDVFYSQLYTDAVNEAVLTLSKDDLAKAITLAKSLGEYAEYPAEDQNFDEDDDGSCKHGLDPDYCSAGCGEL